MERPLSLLDALSEVPDPRSRHGRRHPLPAVLGLTAVAVLAGMRSLEAIAQFGRDHGVALAHPLGFRRGRTPCKATLSNLFRSLDVAAFEAALARWVRARAGSDATASDATAKAVAIDGKRVRGSRDGEVPGVHLLAAYAPAAAAVLGQLPVEAGTNEHKAALRLLGVVPLQGRVVTGDAAFCQKDFCEGVRRRGGDYLVFVKENQPELRRTIAASFGPDAAFSPPAGPAAAGGAADGRGGRQRARPPRAAAAHQHDRAQ